MKVFVNYLLWLLFPKRCAVCGKIIQRNERFCKVCRDKIERVDKSCTVCGGIENSCECRWRVFRFSGCLAPFHRGENSMRMLYRFKLHGKLDTADILATEIHKKLEKYWADQSFDVVTAVPMTNFKRINRGYNQSELIAKRLAKLMGLEYKNLLKKRPFYKPQHTLDREERYKNVVGMFYAPSPHGYKKVLLVDDIKTTGATLNECTKELLFAGAEDVYCAVAIVNVLTIEN